ncbi:MAG: hypothetical protein KIS88_09860 [Anaerolineales bacterium]|nr:hypothetical protein [Anaerolineales bacterium]
MTAKSEPNARRAAIAVWVFAACFGLPAVPISLYLLQYRRLPWLGDLFPMYGGPWSASMAVPQLAATLWVFAALCLLVAFGGWLLWSGRRSGGILVLATLPIEAVFWYGYALPIPVILALLRVVFVAAAWSGLKRRK